MHERGDDMVQKNKKKIENEEAARHNEDGVENRNAEEDVTKEQETLKKDEAQKDIIEKLEKEKKETFDQLLRLKADFENYKKRTEKERGEVYSRALEELSASLLPVIDNFERAIEAGKEMDTGGFMEGVQMVYGQLVEVLQKEGLALVDAMGCQFDPEYHHAVLTECDENEEDNVILEVFQKGYLFKDRLLRPAMVKVNKR